MVRSDRVARCLAAECFVEGCLVVVAQGTGCWVLGAECWVAGCKALGAGWRDARRWVLDGEMQGAECLMAGCKARSA